MNLDTGHANVQRVEHEKTGAFSSRTTEMHEEDFRVLGLKVASGGGGVQADQ